MVIWSSAVNAVSLDPTIRLVIFCTAIAALIGLELTRKPRLLTSHSFAIIHLISKLVLSGIAITIAHYFYTQLLFLIAILFAELSFRRWISILTIVSAFVVLFLRVAFGPRRDFISIADAETLLIFAVAMLLILMMARLIKREWSNRLRSQALHAELSASHQQLQQSSEQLTELAVVNERNRLARDIHDSLGHHLTAVSIQLEMALKLHERDPSASIEAMKQAKMANQEALQDVRQSVRALRQPNEPFELAPAVKLLIGRIANDQLSITHRLDGDENHYPQSVRLALYRAIQEGLTNAHKHATASRVNLWLQFLPQQARLRIIDDGTGFDLTQNRNGIGLQGLRERVEALGGMLSIDSRPNEGTVLDLTIPQSQI